MTVLFPAAPRPEMVINVDTTRPWDLPDPRTSRGRHPLPTILLLIAGVLAVLTGPVLLRTTTLTLAWQIRVTTPFFWLTDDTVYSLDDVGGGVVALSAHQPNNQHVVWSLPVRGPLAQAYTAANPLIATDLPPTSAAGVHTTVTVEDSSLVYPAAAVAMVYLTNDLIITIDRDTAVAPLAGYGSSRNGLEWTYLVTVRDLSTRSELWARRLPPGTRWSLPGVRAGAGGIVGLPAGPNWLATYTTSGAVDVWDLRTGQTRASRLVGSLAGHAFVAALTDAVVVSQSTPDGGSVLTAYDPVLLNRLWQFRPRLDDAEPVACDPQLCLVSHREVWILDPRTTVVSAQINGTEVRPGPSGSAVIAPYGQNTAVVSTDTGNDRPLAGQWRLVDVTDYGPTAVVVQIHPLGRVDVGLLDVARASVIPLGLANQWSAYYGCLANQTTLACDDGNALTVWRQADRP